MKDSLLFPIPWDSYKLNVVSGAVSSAVERLAYNEKVVGSTPTPPTSFIFKGFVRLLAESVFCEEQRAR